MGAYKFTLLVALATCVGLSLEASTSRFRCTTVGNFADPNDCHNFYHCDSSLIARQGTCMDGQGTYDSEAGVCRVTPCSGPPSTTTTQTSDSAFTCTSKGLHADPSNCHNFYLCDEDMNSIPGTCMDGKGYFEASNQTCTMAACSN